MAVQATQEDLFAVQVEAVGLDVHPAEAESDRLTVQNRAVPLQLDHQGVAVGIGNGPGPDAGHGDVQNRVAGALIQQNIARLVQNGHLEGAAVNVFRGNLQMEGIGGGGGDIQVGDQAFLPHIQPDLPVQAAEGQIVDDEAEGGDLRVLGGVQLYGDAVVTLADQVGDLKAEGGIAAAVMGGLHAVDIDGGDVPRAVKLEEQPLAGHFFGNGQRFPVAADHLIAVGTCIMQGQLSRGVGKLHGFKAAKTGREIVGPGGGEFPVSAKTDHRSGLLLRFSFHHKARKGKMQVNS